MRLAGWIAAAMLALAATGMFTGCGRHAPAVGGAPAEPATRTPAETVVLPVEHDGLTILEAHWGSGTDVLDVRKVLESQIIDGHVQMKADSAVLGDPAPDKKKTLMVTVDVKGKQSTQYFAEGTVVTLGATSDAVAQGPGRGRGNPAAIPPAQRPPAPGAKPPAPGQATNAPGGVANPPAAPSALLQRFTTIDGIAADTSEGVTFKTRGTEGRMLLADTVTTPVVITARLKTDSKNIRLDFGDRGVLIFDWENNGSELRLNDPKTGVAHAVPEQGAIPVNTWAAIRWVLDEKGMRVDVDGVERANVPGDYSGIKGRVGIATHAGAVVTLGSIDVTSFAAGGPIPGESAVSRPAVTKPAQPVVVNLPTVSTSHSLFERFITSNDVVLETTADAMAFRPVAKDGGKLEMARAFKVPLTITARVKTDLNNIRILFGDQGQVIFDWEERGTELRHHDPKTGAPDGVRDQGAIPVNTWATIRWTIDEKKSRVEVNGVERASFTGNYAGLIGRPALATVAGTTLTVQSFDVESLDSAVEPAPAGPLKILSAKWGADTRLSDVTAKVQARIKEGRAEFRVDTQSLGDPAPGTQKELAIAYELNGKRRVQTFRDGEDVFIGGLKPAWVQRVADVRQGDPQSIVVLEANWIKDNSSRDVVDICQKLVSGESLTVPVVAESFNQQDGSWYRLALVYYEGDEVKSIVASNGSTIQIGKNLTSFVRRQDGAKNLDKYAAELRKKYPTGLIVLDARWGNDRGTKDVTDICQSAVSGDSLTVLVKGEAFGEPDNHENGFTTLTVTYMDSVGLKSRSAGYGATLQIGTRVTSFVGGGKGLQNMDKALADLRQAHPSGLLILDARWGKDRTAFVQDAVSGDSLTIPVRGETFSEPEGEWWEMQVLYYDGKEVKTAKTPYQGTLQIGPRITSFLQANGGLAVVDKVYPDLRSKYGDGLVIIGARFGTGGRWEDVTGLLQKKIVSDHLSDEVGKAWPHPWEGADEKAEVTYWDGQVVKAVTVANQQKLDLSMAPPAALQQLAALPKFTPEGKLFQHDFKMPAIYTLKEAPKGAALSDSGQLTWTPGADAVGLQTFKFMVRLGTKEYLQAQTIEVVGAKVIASVNGDLSKLDGLMRLPLAGEKHQYVVNPDMSGALVLEPNQVVVIGPDGTTVVRKVPLARGYLKIGERKSYFVAIHDAPAAMDLLDKTTGKVIKTIKLDYRDMMDLALAPNKPISYVSAMIADTVPQGRIVQVDEEKGVVREPKGFMGNFMAMDRSGKHMWVGLSDIYQNGTDYYINPGFNIVDIPTYGNIDYLLQYDLTEGGGPVLRQHLSNVGGNGGPIRMSPDGKRVTYLSFTGYPMYSKNLGGWDGLDFEKKPVVYDFQGQNEGIEKRLMDYHPLLPLVVSPNPQGATFFGRESGDKEDRVKIAPGVLQGVTVKDARFSPDGLNVILECQKGTEWFMYKVPLILSEEERSTIKRGIPPEPMEKDAPVPAGGAGGVRT